MKYFLATALFLASFPATNAGFILPDFPEGGESAFSGWTSFTDPLTDFQLPESGQPVPPFPVDEGNAPNHFDSTHFTARLIQNRPDARAVISSSGGIYSHDKATRFLIVDRPTFETDAVLLQIRTIGNLPDFTSAVLHYRESEEGLLKVASAPRGSGYLQEGGSTFAMWEWDLSEEQVFDFFITFAASDNAMSLQEVQLDTFDQPTDNLGVALQIETTSVFISVGSVEHHRIGDSEPQATYRIGDRVEVRPVPVSFYEHEFVGWTGDLSGNSVPEILTIGETPRVKAVFAPRNYRVWSFNQINPYISPPASERRPADADPDRDGLSNLLEYALGGLPEVSDRAEVYPRVELSATGEALFTYRRQMAATDLTYRVLVSTDLTNWVYNGDGSGQIHTEELPDPLFNGDGTETVTVRPGESFASDDSLFFRLEVLYQPAS